MKKLIVISLLLPFLTFAADSVEITGISSRANGTAIASGSSVYDTSTETEGLFNSNSVGTTGATNWTFETSGLKSGQNSFEAKVGGMSVSINFSVPSNEGGLRSCQIDGSCPTYGLSAPTIPSQNLGAVQSRNRAKDGTLVTIQNLFELLAAGLI